MRADVSPPEQLLWAGLTSRKLGVSFRRQVPLVGYICDFVCASRRLVVEVDGAHHRGRRAADARRDACLARLGLRVPRLEKRRLAPGCSGANPAIGWSVSALYRVSDATSGTFSTAIAVA